MGMNVCEDHDDSKVIYDVKKCPFCLAVEKIHDLQQEAGGLQEQVDDLKKELDDAKSA